MNRLYKKKTRQCNKSNIVQYMYAAALPQLLQSTNGLMIPTLCHIQIFAHFFNTT